MLIHKAQQKHTFSTQNAWIITFRKEMHLLAVWCFTDIFINVLISALLYFDYIIANLTFFSENCNRQNKKNTKTHNT